MAKHIVVCSDGTGNTAIKGRGTNVFKFYEAIDLNGHRTDPQLCPQLAFYDDGVGTEAFKPLKLFAGMTGFGLSRNVRQLYKEVCRVYDPGDRLFLIGFSRGAFTVRTLAGLISRCGILDVSRCSTAEALDATVKRCYRAYRRRYRTRLAQLFLGAPRDAVTAEFRRGWCLDCEVPIAFLGVWDTVDAVGLPFHLADIVNTAIYRFKFPDQELSGAVERACHALALDDERHSFHPLLWNEDPERLGRIQQVWFAGAHSNVGGGYPKQGMSLVALDWMMSKAGETGLRFIASDRSFCAEHANVDDKLYDPRAGLGIFYRWFPREVARMCGEHGVRPSIHVSVLERIAHGTDDYSPGNLPATGQVVITETGDRVKDAAALERAREVTGILASAGTGDGLFETVRLPFAVGRVSYYVYVVSCALVVLAVLPVGRWAALPALGLVVSYLMSLYTDRRMGASFSGFWHALQPNLREALKRARRTTQGAEPGPAARLPFEGSVGSVTHE